MATTRTDVRKVSILGKDSIHCGFNLVPYIVNTVVETLVSSTYVLITDTVVASYHLQKFQDEFSKTLQGKSARFLYTTVPPGETSKSREGKALLEDFLLANKCTRDTVVLALGGGVIGDLVGFVAATFMRGVRFCQIPTTLLAMVDSSVGGKTAIDTPHGKNLIGAFWQPEYIFIDAAFLETLPPREFSNGMAEVIKTAAIWNEEEFKSLESRSAEIFSAVQSKGGADEDARQLLLSVIVGSISVKAHIVTVDERETGLRNIVNFGHTIGHAIEAIVTPTILHGECVAVGMILEAEVSRSRGILGQVAVGRLTRCLRAYNLPTSLSDPRIASIPAAKLINTDRLLDIMAIDKKNSGKAKKVVLLSRIGKTYEERATVVADSVIRTTLCEAVKVISGIPSKHPVHMSTPGSKSISNRALLLAALAGGTCRLKNLLHSDDTQVMMNALIELKGAKFHWEDGGETLVVEGGKGALSPPPPGKEIYLGNAGTAARFLTTVCTLVQSNGTTPTVITGNARMKQRPIGPLVTALSANGCNIAFKESEGCLPLAIAPSGLPGGRIELAASVSSQYVSSILLCAPYAAESVVLELTGGQVISQPYIDMTIAMMRTFGIAVERHTDPATGSLLNVYTIPRGTYTNPPVYSIESDASSATYPLAIAAMTGTTCTIANIGTASLQGDARFAKDVLEPMGCTVVQTETETTVTGPPVGQLRALGLVDMEPMTDAFLTASVLAAVATQEPLPGRSIADESATKQRASRIIGIANQRVKECNRIQAMMKELRKFGIETKELDDGLEIYGKPVEELSTNVKVHCYDDHRVAMAFSVLGTVVRDTILEEKRCVEKTWPNWWDDLENKIGLHVEGVELESAESGAPSKSTQHGSESSVIIIGMRGSGKTYIGELAARVLGWTFIDLDKEFEEIHHITVKEFVSTQGWEAFRRAETEVLQTVITSKERRIRHIISTGGGIVEGETARNLLVEYGKNYGPVVEVRRDVDEVVNYLTKETERPAYGETIADVYNRRKPWYASSSSHQFENNLGLSSAAVAGRTQHELRSEVERFFKQITGVQCNTVPLPSDGSRRSYFLSLTYPDILPALPLLDELTAGVDAIELRVDLLRGPDYVEGSDAYIPSTDYVTQQLVALRAKTSLPIVFTVRTKSQGGAFPDGAQSQAFALFNLAARTACEYIDVELSWPVDRISAFRKGCGTSQLLASWHDWSGAMKWDSDEVAKKYELGSEVGDIVKIVGKAITFSDNLTLHQFAEKVRASPNTKPLIAINTSYVGQFSRILNPTLSPVTHPLLNVSAAPGQLSVAQINSALHVAGLIPKRRFALLGTPISASPSPTLHNAGFEALGLPHQYGLHETQEVDESVKQLLFSDDFGGASVTIPHKLTVMPLLDELSPHAQAIGAVNTVIVRPNSSGRHTLLGDNTDWIGIRDCVLAAAPDLDLSTATTTGLVLGAGGTARAALYALRALGIKRIYLYNRTRASADALVSAFPGYGIEVLENVDAFPGAPPRVIVSTVPGSATTLDATSTASSLLLTEKLLKAEGGGVVVDMAYRPAETPLLALAAKVNGGSLWARVRGVDVLIAQGHAQFEMWTSKRAPRRVVREKVIAFYEGAVKA